MERFPISNYKSFNELPLEFFDKQKFNIYVLDLNWCYLYVNPIVCERLGVEKQELIGANMWDKFPDLASDINFKTLRNKMESGKQHASVTVSPITSQRISIVGFPLSDCYYFTSSILPSREDLMDELRSELQSKRPKST